MMVRKAPEQLHVTVTLLPPPFAEKVNEMGVIETEVDEQARLGTEMLTVVDSPGDKTPCDGVKVTPL